MLALKYLSPLILQLCENYELIVKNVANQLLYNESNYQLILKTENEHVKEINSLKILIFASIILSGIILTAWYKSAKKLNQRIVYKQILIAKNDKENSALKKKLNSQIEELHTLAVNNDKLFITRFQEIYPDFSKRLLDINPKLALSEIEFCSLLTFNFTSKEIATFSFTSPKTVENKKTRIRKRINVPVERNLRLALKELM